MPDKNGNLTLEETNTVISVLGTEADEALAEPSASNMREFIGRVSDICHSDSLLDVDVEKETVEISGWAGDDESEEDE
jgi:hypothetical protein